MKKRNILSVFKSVNKANNTVAFRRGAIASYVGQPGCGKTTVLIQEAINCVKQGHKVLIIDKELSSINVINWIVAVHKKSFVKKQTISFKEIASVYRRFESDLIIANDVRTIEDLKSVIKENSPDILILNGYNILEYDLMQREGLDRKKFTEILKSLALENDMAILLENQTIRVPFGVPEMTMLRDVGNADMYDLVIFIDKVNNVLNIKKCRYGECLEIPIKRIENTPIIEESK